MTAATDQRERLPRSDVESMFEHLSPPDWTRLRIIANAVGAGLSGCPPDDLLQEAITRLLDGTRSFPKGVKTLVVLRNVMRSISDDFRKRDKSSPVDSRVEIGSMDTVNMQLGGTVEAVASPLDQIAARSALVELEEELSDDEELGMLAIVWSDGIRGAEAMDELGWTEKTYEAARKRMTRRLKALDKKWSCDER